MYVCCHLLLLCPVWGKPFPKPSRLYGETAPLSIPREEGPMSSGGSGNAVTPAACNLCENLGWLPGNRVSRTCLSAFPYLTAIFLWLEGVLPLTKHTGWCKLSPEMQLYCKHPVLPKTAGICSTCCFLFVHHFVLVLFFVWQENSQVSKQQWKKCLHQSTHVHKIKIRGYQRGPTFLKAVIR